MYICPTKPINTKTNDMSKIKTFTFDTPYFNYRKNKVHGYLLITGQVKDTVLCPDDADAEDWYVFDITNVTFLDAAGITHELGRLFHMPEMLDDTLTDCINKATVAHMSYVFAETTQPDTDNLTPTDMDKERNPSLTA